MKEKLPRNLLGMVVRILPDMPPSEVHLVPAGTIEMNEQTWVEILRAVARADAEAMVHGAGVAVPVGVIRDCAPPSRRRK